jgi:hypothetical protein
MKIRGGYTNYGQHIGVLMLDTAFPRLPGDIGNAASFDFPVRYEVVRGVLPQRVNKADPGRALLPFFIDAARKLESEGVKAITTSCGLLASFQAELAASVSVPVFTSTLMLVPFCYQLAGGKKPVGIMTIRGSSISPSQCNGAGWSQSDIPVRIMGMDNKHHFTGVYADNGTALDREILEGEVREATTQMIDEFPEIGTIVLECTNLAPFSPLIRQVSGRPVFGMDELVRFMHRCVAGF